MSTTTSHSGPVGIAIIGAGVISQEYLANLTGFPDVKVHAIADLSKDAAAARASAFNIPCAGTADRALAHPDVEIVVNLTSPAAHVEVSTAAILAGKHVWSEKPLALELGEGRQLMRAADEAGVRIGCAPDTFLGAGLQTALRLIARGDIGQPLSALTLMQSAGPDSWHPNPAFLFQQGAGPLFDIGPYYLTALVQAFGAIKKVAGFGSIGRKTRTVREGPRAGQEFDVTVPTHVSTIAQFTGGASSQSIFSFDSPLRRVGFLEITGTEATLAFPDPNNFDGSVTITKPKVADPYVIPATGATSSRGSGVLEMARAIREDRAHRAQGITALHVLDAMTCISESMSTGETVSLSTEAQAADPLPEDWDPFAFTLQRTNGG